MPAGAQEATFGSQWLTYNNRLDGQRFSPLKEITPANASQLGEVCRVQVDGPTTFHAGLIVVDGVIYTNTGRETLAIDATTCAVRWKHTYMPEEERYSPSNRGVAVLDGRVFRGTGDGRLIALDAATGKLLWKNVIGVPRLGESASAAPLAWQGVVFMGIGGSELGIRGRVMAYDAQTGRELWRFNTIPMGNEKGAETWKRPASAKTGGGGVWGAMSLDPTTGELFVPVGNPWPDIDKDYRPGDNLFTNSIVVLDARTGALKWWYQVAPADWQDLDLAAPPVLYRDSRIRDVLAFGGKDGYVHAVDRDTRKQIFRTPVTTVEHIHKAPSREGARVCPGYAGGVEWNGPALDTLNKTLVTGAVDVCFIVKLGTTEYTPGAVSFGGTVVPDGPTTGWVTSIDSETGEVRWKYHAEKPVIAGVTPTAGNVTFTGDLAGNLLVFNSRTGELVNKVQTGGALAGGVVTYEARGRQYVAFASGNVSRSAFGALGIPTVIVMGLNPLQTSPAVPPTSAVGPGGLTPSAGSPASAGTPASAASAGTPASAASAGTPASAASAGTPASAASAGTLASAASAGTPASAASAGTPASAASAGSPASLNSSGSLGSAVPTGAVPSGTRPGAPNVANGRKLYSQVCVTCHGPDGNLIADHKLGNLKARRDLAATVGYIKDPKAPMPKLYPDLIDEQSVIDVSAFVREELGR